MVKTALKEEMVKPKIQQRCTVSHHQHTLFTYGTTESLIYNILVIVNDHQK